MQKYKHDSLIPVDIIAVKAALSRLVVPAQTAVFGVQKYVRLRYY